MFYTSNPLVILMLGWLMLLVPAVAFGYVAITCWDYLGALSLIVAALAAYAAWYGLIRVLAYLEYGMW